MQNEQTGPPPVPEQEPDWDRFLGMIEAVAQARGYRGRTQSARWRGLARDMGLADNAINRYLKRRPAPDRITLWRLAEFSGIDLMEWYAAAGMLPEALTHVRDDAGEPSAALLILEALETLTGDPEETLRIVQAAAAMRRAGVLEPIPPEATRRRDRGGHRPQTGNI